MFGGGAVSLESRAISIEARLPVASVSRDPRLELFERFSSQRIETSLSVGPHLHDAGFREDAQVTRDAGLMDIHAVDDVADRAFARLHCLDDLKTGRIGQGLQK